MLPPTPLPARYGNASQLTRYELTFISYQGAVTVTVTAAADAATSTADVTTTTADATTTAAAAVDTAAAVAASGSVDLGSCTNPTIQFGLGFDGRKEDSFEPVDQTEFNHGSALNIGIIASFICDVSACSLSAWYTR